jgi:hypothetical protein
MTVYYIKAKLRSTLRYAVAINNVAPVPNEVSETMKNYYYLYNTMPYIKYN